MNPWLMVLLVLLALIILSFCWPLLVIVLAAFLAFKIYEAVYFRSSKFKTLKDSVTQYVADCNALNEHIHELEATEVPGSTRQGSGTARFTDVSRWNYQRAKLKAQTDATNVYSCSRTVCANARKDPIVRLQVLQHQSYPREHRGFRRSRKQLFSCNRRQERS